MTLADSIKSDATKLFVETNDFAESITYHPHNHPGQTTRQDRVINAQVLRQPFAVFNADGGATSLPVWEIHVANDSTLGISSAELDIAEDALTFAPDVGETPVKKKISRLAGHDAGMLVLECR